MLSKLIVLIIAVSVVLWARKSRPAGDQQGLTFNRPQLAQLNPEHLRVATFNIQTGKDINGKRDLRRSAELLSEVDVAGVQEVYAPTLINRLGIGRGQAPRIAALGNFSWLFCATRLRWLREHRGNLLLSKLAVSNWRIQMLPDQSGKSFRNMTVVEMTWQDQSFHLINTHLHTRQGREEQLDLVLREFAKYPRAILLGDLNTRADSPLLANALKNVEITDAIKTAGLDLDNSERIDWILTKGFTVQQGRMVEKGVSDHPFYQVSLSIN